MTGRQCPPYAPHKSAHAKRGEKHIQRYPAIYNIHLKCCLGNFEALMLNAAAVVLTAISVFEQEQRQVLSYFAGKIRYRGSYPVVHYSK